MSRNSVRTVLCVLGVLIVLGVLSTAPLQAKPVRVTGNGTPSVAFLVNLWGRAARLLGFTGEKNGVLIDPDGAPVAAPIPTGTTEEGVTIDPNGRS